MVAALTPDRPPNASKIKIYRNMRILPMPRRPELPRKALEKGPKVFISGFVEVSVSNNREREGERVRRGWEEKGSEGSMEGSIKEGGILREREREK